MKAGIHPVYEPTKIVCVCGHVIHSRTTIGRDELHVEICAECHPFYTGKQKLVDKAGRVERFRRRYENVKKDDGKKAGAAEAPQAPTATATEENSADAAKAPETAKVAETSKAPETAKTARAPKTVRRPKALKASKATATKEKPSDAPETTTS